MKTGTHIIEANFIAKKTLVERKCSLLFFCNIHRKKSLRAKGTLHVKVSVSDKERQYTEWQV